MSIETDHINFLIYRYLLESGAEPLPVFFFFSCSSGSDDGFVCLLHRSATRLCTLTFLRSPPPKKHTHAYMPSALPGFQHSSFTFGQESGVARSAIATTHIPPGSLIAQMQRALNYVQAEINLTEDGLPADPKFLEDFPPLSLLESVQV